MEFPQTGPGHLVAAAFEFIGDGQRRAAMAHQRRDDDQNAHARGTNQWEGSWLGTGLRALPETTGCSSTQSIKSSSSRRGTSVSSECPTPGTITVFTFLISSRTLGSCSTSLNSLP